MTTGDEVYVFPPEAWANVCNLLDLPDREYTEGERADMVVRVILEHPVGHDCVKCQALRAAQSN